MVAKFIRVQTGYETETWINVDNVLTIKKCRGSDLNGNKMEPRAEIDMGDTTIKPNEDYETIVRKITGFYEGEGF